MSEATVVDKRWTYCPECGSTEIRHAEGDHKQCACCLQEWFADIDYTDVVRTNLGNRMQLRSSLTASGELVHELRDALKSLSDMYAFPGESNTERFERVAERFYAETGVIAPGKDVSAGGWNGMTYEDRVKRFEDWYAEKAANARAAMEKANG